MNLEKFYGKFKQKSQWLRKKRGRPLTFAEKILAHHAESLDQQGFVRGQSDLFLKPDRVAMQDATAQMAILQFMMARRESVAAESTVHCDHLIVARTGAKADLESALKTNAEVYDFLRSACARYGIEFWKPGAGIIHQIILENYAFPGGLMIGTDSHTPNAGGLGMLAVGTGGSDAAEVMAGLHWEIKCPYFLGVHLKGRLEGWAAPKDVILKLCGMLTAKGGTNKIVEYFGPGAESISCTGKATITNMGAELGATSSLFAYDAAMAAYLCATARGDWARAADRYAESLKADPEVEKNPEAYFDEVVEIDLSELEPHIVGPHTPDLARPISRFAAEVKRMNYPVSVSAALMGSCTNSSYEDIAKAADLARQAAKAGIRSKATFYVAPGSDQVSQTVERDGLLKDLEAIGGVLLANACGPCIGQWKRQEFSPEAPNSIVTSFNRNFKGRNDGSQQTLAFVASPELVTAFAIAGRLDFNPITDFIENASGQRIRLMSPTAAELPPQGYVLDRRGCLEPMNEGLRKDIRVVVSPESERLQILKPFDCWDGKDFNDLWVLLKASGKCTTDHISPAGPWLRFRGHLERISDNLLLGAVNVFTRKSGVVCNPADQNEMTTPAAAARLLKQMGRGWVIVGDENYGEGSSREHAAMSPRYLGCKAVIVKSFARIHETNLKKQGILPLRFKQAEDYDKINPFDTIDIPGLDKLTLQNLVTLVLHHSGGTSETLELMHTMTQEQIEWFKSGSALNYINRRQSDGPARSHVNDAT